MPSADNEDLRPALCSELSARRGLPLIGTAGFYDAVVAFEIPSPWTPKLAGSRASDAAVDAAIARIGREAKRVRLLAIENDETGGDAARILSFRRRPGAFERFGRTELVVPRARLAEAMQHAAFDDDAGTDEPALRDVLVCTHGARDACCGKFGYPIYRRFSEEAAALPGVRVWRTSHLGGHRFAPTLLDLPSGRLFGRVSHDDVAAILGGGPRLAACAYRLYRGRCALPEAAQIVEREIWSRHGEAVETAAFEAHCTRDADGAFEVRLEARTGRTAIVVEASVERSRDEAVETPASCGRDPESEAPWRIRELRTSEGAFRPKLDSARGFS